MSSFCITNPHKWNFNKDPLKPSKQEEKPWDPCSSRGTICGKKNVWGWRPQKNNGQTWTCGQMCRCQEGARKDESSRGRDYFETQRSWSVFLILTCMLNRLWLCRVVHTHARTHTPLVEKGTECHHGSLPIAPLRAATAEHAERLSNMCVIKRFFLFFLILLPAHADLKSSPASPFPCLSCHNWLIYLYVFCPHAGIFLFVKLPWGGFFKAVFFFSLFLVLLRCIQTLSWQLLFLTELEPINFQKYTPVVHHHTFTMGHFFGHNQCTVWQKWEEMKKVWKILDPQRQEDEKNPEPQILSDIRHIVLN